MQAQYDKFTRLVENGQVELKAIKQLEEEVCLLYNQVLIKRLKAQKDLIGKG